jgi:hypothetical protein
MDETEPPMFLLLLSLGCTYTVRSLTQVSPGGGVGEFYALVRTEHWEAGVLADVDATLIRCVAAEGPVRATTCQNVLTGDEAIRAADREVPLTFGPTKKESK